MKLKIRMESANSKHVHCSIFSDENDCGTYALLGKLCMSRKEYLVYTGIFSRGTNGVKGIEFSYDNLKKLEGIIAEFERKEKEK